MSKRRLKLQAWLAMIGGLTISCTLIVLMAIPGLRPLPALANYLGRQLPKLPEDEVGPQLRRLAKLGDPAIPVLVGAMGSEREIVAHTAVLVLRETLNSWQALATEQSSPKIALLAEQLALQVDSFGSTSRSAAANLITEILIWPVDRQTIDNHQLIANCEVVLRLPLEAPVGITAKRDGRGLQGPPGSTGDTLDPKNSPTADLPSEIVEARSLPDQGLSETPPTEAVPQYPFELPQPGRIVPRNERPLEHRSNTPARLIDEEGVDEPGDDLNLTTAEPLVAAPRLASLDSVSLMKYLRSTDRQTAGAASAELQRRGFTEVDLVLARRLAHPDPLVRMELARDLPRLSGVDARQWLVWLSEDEAASVRSEAVSILATSRDPAIEKHLRELARRETDPSVLRHLR